MYENVKSQIESIVDETVELSSNSIDKMCESKDTEKLYNCTRLSSTSATEHSFIFRGSESDTKYAECRYLEFHTEKIGLIQWLEVNESIRSNGVGRCLRGEMIDDMRCKDIATIYTKLIDSRLVSVAIDQGFRQIQSGDLDGWFVFE